MIEYEECQKFDLFRKGNYIGSFNTQKEIWDYLETEIRKAKFVENGYTERGMEDNKYLEERVVKLLNERVYTFLKSYHMNFFSKKNVDN